MYVFDPGEGMGDPEGLHHNSRYNILPVISHGG